MAVYEMLPLLEEEIAGDEAGEVDEVEEVEVALVSAAAETGAAMRPELQYKHAYWHQINSQSIASITSKYNFHGLKSGEEEKEFPEVRSLVSMHNLKANNYIEK